MPRKDLTSIASTVAAVAVAGLVAWAGSSGSAKIGSIPVFAIGVGLAFVINWLAYVPSYLAKTEKYFDLVGSLTYISVTLLALAGSRDLDLRAVLVAVAVMIWASRLGSFLFARIRRDGHDRRFDAIKVDPLRLLMTWTLQGLWVSLTLASALAAITAEQREAFGILAAVGLVLWAVGFGIEVVADRQKQAFRADPANQDRFITDGLWAWSRHPNYFGEILLWFGTAVLAIPVLDGWRLVTLVSPVFVYLLLTRISGVPLLEARARKKWGAEAAFQEYMRTTPALIPRPPGRSPRPAPS